MKKLIAILLFLAFLPIVNAQSDFDIGNVSIERLQEITATKGLIVPESVRFMVKEDERINLIVKDTINLNVVLENYALTSINEGLLENPTLEIVATRDAVNTVSKSDDAKTTLTEAINSGEIQINPQGFLGKVKFGFAKLFLKFL